VTLSTGGVTRSVLGFQRQAERELSVSSYSPRGSASNEKRRCRPPAASRSVLSSARRLHLGPPTGT
jgi:hypothetical protein